jgi:hypothetical protein
MPNQSLGSAEFIRQLRIALGLLGLLMVFLLGCDDIPPRPPLGKNATVPPIPTPTVGEQAKQPAVATDNGKTADAPDLRTIPYSAKPIETWDRLEIGGLPVGYSYTAIQPVDGPGGLVEVSLDEALMIRRRDQVIHTRSQHRSHETSQGQLISFEGSLLVGNELTELNGKVGLDRLNFNVRSVGKPTQSKSVNWDQRSGSFLAVPQSLRNQPLQDKEVRKLRIPTLVINQYLLVDVLLTGDGYAKVPVDRGEVRRLLEIRREDTVDGKPFLRQVLWMDEAGEVLKSYVPGLDLLSIRTDQAGATKASESVLPDLMVQSRIALDRALPPDTKRTVFRVTHADDNASLPSSGRQQVTRISPAVFEVVVGGNAASTQDTAPTDLDTAASDKIEINDPAVVALAAQGTAPTSDPWKLAQQLREIVTGHVKKKDFSQAFLSAAEVAKERAGDCTEHAVLLTALCRARGIPARLAAGIVQTEDRLGPCMNYHLWTLVWDGDSWRALDAAFGNRNIGADRIELLTTDLADGDSFACMAPILLTIGQLKVEIISPQY